MKYRILLALMVEADPADFGGAARAGFNALADKMNSDEPVEIHLLPQDGSPEAVLGERVLASCFKAESKPSFC
jgi:hypothetical protein